MKIAVCDDEYADLQLIVGYLNRYDPTLNVTTFSSARKLLDAFSREFYDLIFMDLEMENPNGYEVSVELMSRTDKPLIIFTTKSSEYTIQGYGIAFRYVMKPITYEKFEKIISLAVKSIIPQRFTFSADGKERVLLVNSISYFEVFNHNTVIHTKTAQYSIRSPLSNIMTQLNGCNFVQSHASFFVNLAFIDHVESNQIILTTGEQIRLSRDKRNQFILALMKYMREDKE